MVTTGDMWDKFMNNPSIECLDLFANEYAKSRELGDLRNHNLVLIDVGEWQKVKSNYIKIFNEEEHIGDSDFIEIGMAEWFLGNINSAISFWKQSLDAPYALCPGAPDGPLLLWYAGQRLNDKKLIKESLKKLKGYWKVPDYKVWPGWQGTVAIAGFLLDKVPVNVFLYEWKGQEGSLEYRRSCRANFWVGMKCLEESDETTAVAYFKSAFSGPKIAILQYEYFLAKWEYANITNDWSMFCNYKNK